MLFWEHRLITEVQAPQLSAKKFMWIVTGTGRQHQLGISVKASELDGRIIKSILEKMIFIVTSLVLIACNFQPFFYLWLNMSLSALKDDSKIVFHYAVLSKRTQ